MIDYVPACFHCGKSLPLKWRGVSINENGERHYNGRADVRLFCSKKCFEEEKK